MTTTPTWIIGVDPSACAAHTGQPHYTGPFTSRDNAIDYISAQLGGHLACFSIILIAPPIGANPFASGGIIPTTGRGITPTATGPWPSRDQLSQYLQDTPEWTCETIGMPGDTYRHYNTHTKTEYTLLLRSLLTHEDAREAINNIRSATGAEKFVTTRQLADAIISQYPTTPAPISTPQPTGPVIFKTKEPT